MTFLRYKYTGNVILIVWCSFSRKSQVIRKKKNQLIRILLIHRSGIKTVYGCSVIVNVSFVYKMYFYSPGSVFSSFFLAFFKFSAFFSLFSSVRDIIRETSSFSFFLQFFSFRAVFLWFFYFTGQAAHFLFFIVLFDFTIIFLFLWF